MDGIAIQKSDAKLKRLSIQERSDAISQEFRRVARKARIPKPITSGGGGFRARRSDKLFRRFLIGSFILLFIFPSIVSGMYYGFLAANQYVSEARFAVKSSDGAGLQGLSSLTSLLGGVPTTDAAMIAEYIHSRTIIQDLSNKFNLKEMFSPSGVDFVSPLKKESSLEDLLEYWESKVGIDIDRATGLATLHVRTFSPEDSLEIAREILRLSEKMVNRLTGRNQANGLREATDELDRTKRELERRVSEMRDARNQVGILDAEITTKAFSDILTALNLEAARLNVQIQSLKKSEATDGPHVRALVARSESLQQQIASYQDQLASNGSTGTLQTQDGENGTIADRSAMLSQKGLELRIAQNEYARASAAFELARMTSERQRSYLLVYVQPQTAEESLYPRRVLSTTAIVVASFLIWAATVGVAVLVRDHTAS